MSKKYKYISLILFPITLFINHIASKFPNLVEKYYSTWINKLTIEVLSKVSGLIEFSLYEVIVYILIISMLIFLIRLILVFTKKHNVAKRILGNSILNILSTLSICYFLFILLWGINYNRLPLQTSLLNRYNLSNNTKIENVEYTNQDLKNLYKFLINKANETRFYTLQNKEGSMMANTNYKGIISRAQIGYNNISNIIPEVQGNYSNAKYIKSSKFMSYTGITGIYFPFTGEANINIDIPDIYIPCTVIHEMAHQRGFASEDEANFIAYLASINHTDIDFNYSGYILALSHTASALRDADPSSYELLTSNISDSVRRDLEYNNNYWKNYNGKISEISDKFNNSYLKSNGVKDGTKSYGKMVDLLLAYYKLYPYDEN